jgi:hypothetical protein
MDPVTITMIVLGLASTGYSLGKQNQANLKAKRDGDAAVEAAKKASEAERLAMDAQYLADVQQALATAQLAQTESAARAAKLNRITRLVTFMALGLLVVVVLKFWLDRRLQQ